MQLNNLHSAAMAFTIFLERNGNPYGKNIATHDSSGSRSPCSHRCAGELQTTVDRSICVTSVHCLDSSLFCSSKVGRSARYYRIQLLQRMGDFSYWSKLPQAVVTWTSKFLLKIQEIWRTLSSQTHLVVKY